MAIEDEENNGNEWYGGNNLEYNAEREKAIRIKEELDDSPRRRRAVRMEELNNSMESDIGPPAGGYRIKFKSLEETLANDKYRYSNYQNRIDDNSDLKDILSRIKEKEAKNKAISIEQKARAEESARNGLQYNNIYEKNASNTSKLIKIAKSLFVMNSNSDPRINGTYEINSLAKKIRDSLSYKPSAVACYLSMQEVKDAFCRISDMVPEWCTIVTEGALKVVKLKKDYPLNEIEDAVKAGREVFYI